MDEDLAREELGEVLDRLGLQAGDRVMLGIDMGRVPLPRYKAPLSTTSLRSRRRRWCQFVLDVLVDRLTPHGTLLVPSFSYSCSKPGSSFILEETPSENGPFTEFVRSQPGAIRSLHPIFSLSGIGRDAEKILGNVGRSAFGAMSPYSRFAREGVKFLCLGVELRNCVTYGHHLEQTYGCPHRYNKAFKTAVSAHGKSLPGEWYAYLGYRNLNYSADFRTLQAALSASGDLREAMWRGSANHLVETDAVDTVGYNLLRQDSSSFVDRDLHFGFDDLEHQCSTNPLETFLRISVSEGSEAN